ncbi:MAG: phage tail tape measure protein [Desulfobulbaceae bacterium]|jgi:TP901 family phage tail tape measure protein|nr:phage tail tape measure protein [Desulfobulbaceae bacterium]
MAIESVMGIALKLLGLEQFKGGVSQAGSGIAAVKGELSRLGQSARLDGLKRAESRLAATGRELRETKEETRRLAQAMRGMGQPTLAISEDFTRAKKRAAELKREFREQTAAIHRLKKEMTFPRPLSRPSPFPHPGLPPARGKEILLPSPVPGEGRGKEIRVSGALTGLAEAGAGIAVLRGMTAPLKTFMDFEEAMSAVKAKSGATGQEFERLKKQALDLGESTSFSASQVAAGQNYLAQSGFKTEKIIASMPGLLNMARAGALDLGEASGIAADILSGFQLEASEMGRVSDVLTAAFTSSNTTLSDLGNTMKYVGPVAVTAGMNFEQAAAAAGLLGNVGIKGEQAGTTLRAMLLRLSAPTGQAAKAMDSLGIAALDTFGNVRDLPTILKEVAKATEQMGGGQRLAYLKNIFGEEPAAGMAALIEKQGAGGLDKYIKELTNSKGKAAEIAQVMADNTAGSLEEASGAIETLQISLGKLAGPHVRLAAEGVGAVARGLTALANDAPMIATGVGGAVAAMAASLTAVAGWNMTKMVLGLGGPNGGKKGQGGVLAAVTEAVGGGGAAKVFVVNWPEGSGGFDFGGDGKKGKGGRQARAGSGQAAKKPGLFHRAKMGVQGLLDGGVKGAARKASGGIRSLASSGIRGAGAGIKAVSALGVKSALGKAALKKIPLVGIVAGAGFGVVRLFDGDIKGAGLEVLSGAASAVPGLGTAASLGIDAALVARDLKGGSGEKQKPGLALGATPTEASRLEQKIAPIAATLERIEKKPEPPPAPPVNITIHQTVHGEGDMLKTINSANRRLADFIRQVIREDQAAARRTSLGGVAVV